MSIGNKIKSRREQLNMSQAQLARKLKYRSGSSINKIELGHNDITQSKVIEFAEALKTTPSYLMGWEDEPLINNDNFMSIPFLDHDNQAMLVNETSKHIQLPSCLFSFRKHYFYFYMNDNSMLDENIQANDLLIFESTTLLKNGNLGLFVINNEKLCRKYYFDLDKKTATLVAASGSIQPILFTDLNDFEIIGKLTYVLNKK